MPAPQYGTPTTQFPYVLGEPDANTVFRSVNQTMLTDKAELKTFFRLATNRVFYFGAFPGPFGGPTGEIGQFADSNYKFFSTSNTVFAGQFSNLSGYNQRVFVRQFIGLEGPRTFAFVGNNVGFQNTVAEATLLSLGNSFNFNTHDGEDATAVRRIFGASNAFAFNENLLNIGDTQLVFQFFDLDEAIDTGATEFTGDIVDRPIRQTVSFRITEGPECPEKEYSPFTGVKPDPSAPEVPNTPPTLGSADLTLTYPFTSPTTTLTLRKPEFGNDDVLIFSRIDRRTTGGDRKIFSDPAWGSRENLRFNIENLSECKVTVDEVIQFLNDSLGAEIGLLDWEGRQWKGYIDTPNTDVFKRSRTVYAFELSFVGELA